jgi:transcriptional regulator with XRE-family HTH domain
VQDKEDKMDYYKLFAQRLNEAIELRDMSAAEIARRSNISEPMISRYRSGQYMPRMKALDRLADVLQVSSRWLLGESDNMLAEVPEFTLDLVPAEYDLVMAYRRLTRQHKSLIVDFAKMLVSRQRDT